MPRLNVIKGADGKLLTESDDIKRRWKEYAEGLFKETGNDPDFSQCETAMNEAEQLPPPTVEQIRAAMKRVKLDKSVGCDNIPIELITAGGEAAVKIFHKLIVSIWETGEWPQDWCDSLFAVLHKKGDPTECSNNRTIALISHASKILLYVLFDCIEEKIDSEVSEEQAGFRKGRGTRDQLFNIRQLMEKCREFCHPLFLCFIDYKKAFDSVLKSQEALVNHDRVGF
jgi:hypothetical protein